MHAHCILPNCPESPIGNWENIRHAPQRAAQLALVSMCVPHTIRVYSCLVLSLHTLLVISAAAKCHRWKYRHWRGDAKPLKRLGGILCQSLDQRSHLRAPLIIPISKPAESAVSTATRGLRSIAASMSDPTPRS